MIYPNLPKDQIKKAIVSCEILDEIEYNLNDFGIELLKIAGKLNCDEAVKNHPDIYFSHLSKDTLIYAQNKCSVAGDLNFINLVNSDFEDREIYSYPDDAKFNCVVLGNRLIGKISILNKSIIKYANDSGYELIDINQGYAKCNICVVNDNSIITEDIGIAKTLTKHGINVLHLKNHAVKIKKYNYGFIGGASGKISIDKLAFLGNIKLHPEYREIFNFLYSREVEAISLSRDVLTDYGSLLPVE